MRQICIFLILAFDDPYHWPFVINLGNNRQFRLQPNFCCTFILELLSWLYLPNSGWCIIFVKSFTQKIVKIGKISQYLIWSVWKCHFSQFSFWRPISLPICEKSGHLSQISLTVKLFFHFHSSITSVNIHRIVDLFFFVNSFSQKLENRENQQISHLKC